MRLRCYVYRDAKLGDCTNGGVSSRHDDCILIWDEPTKDLPSQINGTPVLVLVRRDIMGTGEYLHAERIHKPEAQGILFSGAMAGGNLLYSSDSRFPNRYPIKIHDRFERFN